MKLLFFSPITFAGVRGGDAGIWRGVRRPRNSRQPLAADLKPGLSSRVQGGPGVQLATRCTARPACSSSVSRRVRDVLQGAAFTVHGLRRDSQFDRFRKHRNAVRNRKNGKVSNEQW